ncbi:MAG: NmrA family NAD(P)-binding protein [Archangium sp.]
MFAIAGVSGRTGAIAAQTLLAQGQKVRVIVRDAAKGEVWKKQGAEVAVAELSDIAALTTALTGVKGVYLLSPPDFTVKDFVANRRSLLDGVAKAVKAAKVPAVVFLSSVGAQVPSGTGPIITVRNGEASLRDAAPSVTFVRAAYFVENWGSVLGLAKSQGILPHYGPIDVKFSQVTTRDIGEAAARALLNPGDGVRIIELAGREDVSVQDVAAAVSKILGKPVHAVSAPVEQAHAGLLQAGLPDPMAGLYAEMYAGFASGKIGWEKPASITRGTSSLIDTLRPMLG